MLLKRVLRLGSVGGCLLVIAFIVGSCNVQHHNNTKKYNRTIHDSSFNIPLPSSKLSRSNTRIATNTLVRTCSRLIKQSKEAQKIEYRTLAIPKEHLMVRSCYQQLGRLAFIYAHCQQYLQRARHGDKGTNQPARTRLVKMNKKLINECITQYTKSQIRTRSDSSLV